MNLKRIVRKVIDKIRPSKEVNLYNNRLGQLKVKSTDKYSLVSYEKDGVFDYETYKEIQELGNKRKLDTAGLSSSAKEDVTRQISEYALEKTRVRFALCHGTRNGIEQKLFRKYLPDCEVLGTEISETATQFPDTIEWDFHEVKPEWVGHCDLLFSNSWDHSYDPEKLFKAWASCISDKGIMAIEHNVGHEPDKVDPLDPFGISFQGLVDLVSSTTELEYENVLEIGGKNNRRIAMFCKPG